MYPCRNYSHMFASLRRWLQGSGDDLAGQFRAKTFESLPYRHFGASDKSLPLVVFLHGAGGAGTDNRRQLERGNGFALSRLADSGFPCQIIAPQCPANEAWWSATDSPSRSAALLVRLLNQIAADRNQVYLLGVSMGGHGVWDLGWRYPQLWAALVPICGAIPVQRTPLLANTPIWCFHGAEDRDVPVEGSRRAVQSLQAAGAPVRYTEMAGVGHSCTREVFSRDDLLPWLFQQSREPKSSSG